MSPANESAPSRSKRFVRLLAVVVDTQTYRHLLYLVLAFPLGLWYYFVVGFGLTVGLVFSVVLIGLAVLAGTVGLVRLAAGLERRLANTLLSTDLAPADDVADASSGRFGVVRRYVDAPSTWRSLSFVTMKLLVGIVGLVLVIVLISAIQMATAPLHYPHAVEFGELNGEPIVWAIDIVAEAAVGVPIGAILAISCLHVRNALAYVCARMTEALLGRTS